MKSVYTIILNYNNYEDTFECIQSLKKIDIAGYIDNKIVLIDNSSIDGSGVKLKQYFEKDLIFLSTERNIGYAAGNNVGIKYAIEHGADYICILNNDTFVEENFYEECIRFLDENTQVAFVGPTVEEYDKKIVQSTGGDIIIEKGTVSVKNNGMIRQNLTQIIECDYVGGACMIFRADLISEIGMIPENYFLFFEETEWCYKVKRKGYKNVCLRDVYIKHKGSASIDTYDGLHAYLMERNRAVFLKRNAPSKMVYARAILYLHLKYIKNGFTIGKHYFEYIKYLHDGMKNRVDYEKFPYIYIKD